MFAHIRPHAAVLTLATMLAAAFAAPRANADVTVAEGPTNIIVQTVARNAVKEAMLQVEISNPPGQPLAELTSARITAGALGTGDDLAGLAAGGVDLYLDVNKDGRVTLGGVMPDTLLGSGSFSADGGTINFAGLTVGIPVNGSIDLVAAYTFAAGASLGESFQAVVAANTDLVVRNKATLAPIAVVGAPVNGFPRTVGAGKITFQRIVQSPDGGVAIPNRLLLPVLNFTATAQDVENVDLNSLDIQDIGDGNAASLVQNQTLRLFRSDAAPTDSNNAIGSASFPGDNSRATINISGGTTIPRNQAVEFWVTVDVAALNQGQIGLALQFQIPSTTPAAALGAFSGLQVATEGVPLNGPVWTYNYNPILLAKTKDPVAALMPSLARNYVAFVFTLQSDPVARSESAQLTSMTFHASGTMNEGTAISEARFYLDGGTIGRRDAEDTYLGTGNFSGDDGDITFTFGGTPVALPPGTAVSFLVAYDLNGAAVDGQTHSLTIQLRSDITAVGDVSLVNGNPVVLPFVSNARTVGQPRATLTLDTTQKNFPSLIAPEATDFPILGFTLKADIDENLNLAGINFDLVGPLSEVALFDNFELWTDGGTIGIQDGTDAILGVATALVDNGGEGKLILTIPDDQQPLVEKTKTLRLALYADVKTTVIGEGSEFFNLIGANNDSVIFLGETSRAQAKFTSVNPPFSLLRTIRNPVITIARYPATPSPYFVCINGSYGMAGVTFSAPSAEDLSIESVRFTVNGTLDDPTFIANGLAWKDTNKNFKYDSGDASFNYRPAPVKVDNGEGLVDFSDTPITVERTTANYPIATGVDFEALDPATAVAQLGKTITMYQVGPTAISGRGARSHRPIEVINAPGDDEGLTFTMSTGQVTVTQDSIVRTSAAPGANSQEVFALNMATTLLEGAHARLVLQTSGTLNESQYIKPDHGIAVYFDGNRNGKIGDSQDYLCFRVNRPAVDNGSLILDSTTAQYAVGCTDVIYSASVYPYDQYIVAVDLTEDAPEGATLQFRLDSVNDAQFKGSCSLADFTVGNNIIYPVAPPLVGSVVTVHRGQIEITTASAFATDLDNQPAVVMAPGAAGYEVARLAIKATAAENVNLRGLTIKADGTADEIAAIADLGVALYKGAFTATTTPLAKANFDADNGIAVLTQFSQAITVLSTTATDLRLALTGSGAAQVGQTINLSISGSQLDALGLSSALQITEIIPSDPWINIPIVFGPGRLTVRADGTNTKILPLTVTGGATIQALKFTASRTEPISLQDIAIRARGTSNELLALESGAVLLSRNSPSPAVSVGSAPFDANDGLAEIRSLDAHLNADQSLTVYSLNSQLNLAGTVVGDTLRYDIEGPGSVAALGETSGLPVQIVLEDFAGGDSVTDAETISGRTVTLSTGIVNLSNGSKNPAGGTIAGAEQNLPLMQMKLVVDGTLEAVRVTDALFCFSGTADALNLFSALRLYIDVDNDGQATGSDTQLGTGVVADVGGIPTLRFNAINQNMPVSTTKNWLVVGDLNSGALLPGQNFRLSICQPPTLIGVGTLTQQPINIVIGGQSPAGGGFSAPAATPTPNGTVGPSPSPTPADSSNGSVLLGNTFPTQINANDVANVTFTYRNSGNTTWSPGGGYHVKITNDTCGLFAPAATLEMAPATTTAPNTSYVFSAPITAPALGLNCAVALRMEQAGVSLFGQSFSASLPVTVVAPRVTRQPEGQFGNPGQNLLLACRASGSAPLAYQWFKNSLPIDGATSNDLALNAATSANSGIYRCQVSNLASTVNSLSVNVTVYGSTQPNSAHLVGSTIPSALMPGQSFLGTVVYENNSNVSWSPTQGYSLRTVADLAGLVGGAPSFPITDAIAVVPALTGRFVFPVRVTAPSAPGTHTLTLQMQEGSTPFGEPFSVNIVVGDMFDLDLTASPAGWLSGVLGSGQAASGASGLCMTAPLLGDNFIGWVSPEAMLPLVDLRAMRLRVATTTDQTAVDAIPLWDFIYDNYNTSGYGNSYGGEAIFLDQSGGANGIGRPQGHTNFEIWAMPVAAQTLQWRGLLPGQDNSNSAFNPAFDAYNDMRVVFRILDLDSAGVLAQNDSGQICVNRITAQGFATSALTPTTVWAPPLNTATHSPQTIGQINEQAGTAVIDNNNAAAFFALTASGAGSRKTLIPFDTALFDANNPSAFAPLYPILWESNTLYKGTLYIYSAAPGPAEGVDPLDTIFVNFDAATNEVINIHVTLVGAPGNFYHASSPRLRSSTNGVPQPYSAYYFAHNSTAYDLGLAPNANKFRMQGDFFNTPEINLTTPGADPIVVTGMRVERAVVPAP